MRLSAEKTLYGPSESARATADMEFTEHEFWRERSTEKYTYPILTSPLHDPKEDEEEEKARRIGGNSAVEKENHLEKLGKKAGNELSNSERRHIQPPPTVLGYSER